MDIDIKNRLDALLKKIEDQDSDTATLSPGISPLTEKLLLYLGVQLDNLDITTELEKLKDVEIEGPAHHQALVYDAEKEKWVNDYVEGGAAGATKLDELTDVHFSGLEDGESLVYDSVSDKWINKMVDTSIFMEDIVDTDIEEPRSGQVLVYDGDEITWKNSDALISAESKISALENADSAIKSSVESVAARATALETRAANLEQEYGQQQASLIVLSSQITYATHVAEGALGNEAAEYQTNVQYFPGDYCTYQYGLYKCIGNTSGAWNNAKWERVKVCDEIKLVKSSADNAVEIANNAASSAASAWNKAESATGVANSAANVAATALESAMTAYGNAESAMASASEAVGVAESALSSAAGAFEIAGSALSSSSEAYSLASMAAVSASEAWSVASSAAATAESALSSAESAFSLASAAKESAEAAYVTADSAVSIAIGASADASEALSSAQAAYSAAQGAKTSAQSAIQTASSAMTLASAAITSAQTAIEIANAAKTSADLAYGTAESALASAEYAYASASSAFYVAGVALADASAAGVLAQSATQQAVDAAHTANSALLDAGTAMTTANSAFASASDAITFAQAAQSSADSAISIATDASNSAAAAYTSAQTAISTANSAKTSAQSAYTTAGQAKTSAQGAYSKAESALSSAEIAYGTAESALTSASSAYTYAAQAKTSAQTAYTTANAAASDAADALLIAGVAASDAAAALDSASTAVTTANSALTSAQTAYTTASAAKTSAQSAYTMADEAKTSAATAISTANSAKSSATTAYNTASAAKTSADVAYTTADSAYALASAALPNTTKYGSSITVSINSTNYKITTTLKDQDGNALGNAQTIDLPLESVVVNGTFDSANKKIVLTLQNGNTVDIPVGDLVAGLQTEITDENKLNSDLVTDSNQTHKFVTSAQISKLNGIAAGAEVNVQSDWNVSDSTSDAFIKNKPTKLADFSDDSTHRLVSDTEKTKWNATSVFKELTTEDLDNVKEVGFYVGKAGNTCANKPSGVVQFGLQVVKLATDAVYYKQILTRPTASPGDEYVRTCVTGTWGDWKKRVDFSGSYNDLSNQPTIPTVNNATLTIQKNGTTVSTFTANASSNVTANITVPQKTSELVNDSGFITDISGKVSKSGDTMTGELLSADRSIRIQNITAARVFSVEAASGGRVQLHYATSGNHGIYSYGYGDSLSDTTTFTSSPQWIIGRNAEGAVFISNWASRGNSTQPIYINSEGSATACTYSLEKSVPSDAVFTDEKVKITNDTSTNQNLRVLLGTSSDNTTVTESVKKSAPLAYNPSTGVFYSPRVVINSTDANVPLIVRTDNRTTTPSNGDDIPILNGSFKKTISGTDYSVYNSVVSLIGNNASSSVGVVRFGSSIGATIITGGANAKAFPKNFVNTDSTTGKYNSDGAIWLAAQSEVHIYTNASNSAAKFGGHIWMNQGGLRVDRTDAAAGSTSNMYVIVGNNTAQSSAGSAKGILRLYNQNSTGTGAFYVNLDTNILSANRSIHLPNGDGTLQLQSTMSAAELTTGTATTSRTVRADTLKSGIQQIVDERHLWREIASTTSGSSFTFDIYDYFSGAKFPELFIECNTVADRCYVTAGSHGSGAMYTFSFELNAVGNVKPIKLDTTGRSSYIEPVGGDCLSGYGIFDEVRITALEGYTNLEVHVYMRS